MTDQMKLVSITLLLILCGSCFSDHSEEFSKFVQKIIKTLDNCQDKESCYEPYDHLDYNSTSEILVLKIADYLEQMEEINQKISNIDTILTQSYQSLEERKKKVILGSKMLRYKYNSHIQTIQNCLDNEKEIKNWFSEDQLIKYGKEIRSIFLQNKIIIESIILAINTENILNEIEDRFNVRKQLILESKEQLIKEKTRLEQKIYTSV
jgi:hypothetical protein